MKFIYLFASISVVCAVGFLLWKQRERKVKEKEAFQIAEVIGGGWSEPRAKAVTYQGVLTLP